MRILRTPEEAPIDPLRGKRVAVVGFGNQGYAHALNLRESGVDVVVGTRPNSPSFHRASTLGFDCLPIPDIAKNAKLVILALPDEVQPQVYERDLAPQLKSGSIIGFLHGFNICYDLIQPAADLGVILVAPKGPGDTLRRLYCDGKGLPCLFAVHQDSPAGDAEAIGLAWANAIGCARAAIVYTTFRDETETDLFGEQAVLCGGMSQLMVAAFETLVDAGYPPELAYLECCHEMKQVADLVYQRGLAGMYKAISNTAEFGAYRAGPLLIDAEVRVRMRQLLSEIRDGTYAKAVRDDYAGGFRWFMQQREAASGGPIESAGEAVRNLMPWLAESTDAAPPEPKKP
ncbi:MAG: ketol-acid reductoisomerase [Planctomycetes bacterium]|nr:ketol-acid reductoisomerase [Planctomycetota bacterium]